MSTIQITLFKALGFFFASAIFSTNAFADSESCKPKVFVNGQGLSAALSQFFQVKDLGWEGEPVLPPRSEWEDELRKQIMETLGPRSAPAEIERLLRMEISWRNELNRVEACLEKELPSIGKKMEDILVRHKAASKKEIDSRYWLEPRSWQDVVNWNAWLDMREIHPSLQSSCDRFRGVDQPVTEEIAKATVGCLRQQMLKLLKFYKVLEEETEEMRKYRDMLFSVK